MNIFKVMVTGAMAFFFMGIGFITAQQPEGYSWLISGILLFLGYVLFLVHFRSFGEREQEGF